MRGLIRLTSFLLAISASGQQPPAPDGPSIRVGVQLFADYTYTGSIAPPARDAEGRAIHPNSFNVTRAYINVTGNLNKAISFRITPDIARETGSGTSLAGSQTYRLKFAYAQLNLSNGSWIR